MFYEMISFQDFSSQNLCCFQSVKNRTGCTVSLFYDDIFYPPFVVYLRELAGLSRCLY